jgi:hypothetical protein
LPPNPPKPALEFRQVELGADQFLPGLLLVVVEQIDDLADRFALDLVHLLRDLRIEPTAESALAPLASLAARGILERLGEDFPALAIEVAADPLHRGLLAVGQFQGTDHLVVAERRDAHLLPFDLLEAVDLFLLEDVADFLVGHLVDLGLCLGHLRAILFRKPLAESAPALTEFDSAFLVDLEAPGEEVLLELPELVDLVLGQFEVFLDGLVVDEKEGAAEAAPAAARLSLDHRDHGDDE